MLVAARAVVVPEFLPLRAVVALVLVGVAERVATRLVLVPELFVAIRAVVLLDVVALRDVLTVVAVLGTTFLVDVELDAF